MKKQDLRSQIIPTNIANTDQNQRMGNEEFNTRDLIYLDSYDEQYDDKKTDEERRISATDYAQMNNAYTNHGCETRTGKNTTDVWLRSSCDSESIDEIWNSGAWIPASMANRDVGICPSLHYKIQKNLDIKEVKDKNGETIYHTLQIGEYPKTKVDEELSKTLEELYNGGKVKEGIICTGRWYSGNGQKKVFKEYAGKHSPEFEYEGNRYIRIISMPHSNKVQYSDGTIAGKIGTVRWVKVEPISFVIKNWEEMPKEINLNGNGKAEYFDLRAEEAIASNIPFYSFNEEKNSTMWQNSMIRGFFNGIDVRNITQNGNVEYGASKGGNFIGECNFLNEAFNLSREPITEYTVPDSEKEVADDAFNGCITLKKLIIHSNIKFIGENAFDGLNFKYAYKTNTGNLIFSQEIPKNKEEYKDLVEIDKIRKAFDRFDYNVLIQNGKINKISEFSKIISDNKFSIPYIFGAELIKSGNEKLFHENSDFRFFRSEIPNVNDMLANFPEEEKLNFFKFASAIRMFFN